VAKDAISIDADRGVLTISAERHSEAEDKDKKGKYIRRERSYGCYKRSISLGDVDQSNISAKYENGVLTLTMPKKAPELPEAKRIEIE
jgi:HSP20 family protein